ncbi:UrcA family protein [Phenylobacterium sp.]|uniref:UrcA family protein n=1 Tax=Phenylobacterium sp. TaxID=1871053 RepID=UPI00356583D1
MTRMNPIVLLAAGLCLAASAQAAAAQSLVLRQGYSPDSSQVVTSANVPYADIDLASSAGARALLERIEAAADAVCGGEANMASAYEKAGYRACRGTAISGAVARVRSPALAALTARWPTELRAAR